MRIAAILLMASAMAWAATAQADQRTTLDRVLEHDTVRVCTTGDYKPFTYRDPDTGEYSGLDIRMAKDMGSELGVDVRFVQTTWGTLVDDMTAGKCDISMGGISINLQRQQRAYFSIPALVTGKAPITRCENVDAYQSVDAINRSGVTVVVNPGGTNEQFARANLSDAEILVHDDNRTIFSRIVNGDADVMVTDAVEAKLQANLNEELCAVNPQDPFTYAPMGYLLPRGDDVWKAWVDQWLRLTRESGEFQQMYERALQ